MPSNPYSSPSVDTATPESASTAAKGSSLLEIARNTFLAWERLRIVYIALLGLLTILLALPDFAQIEIIAWIVIGAIVSNLCFFAGPVTETYVRWLGYEGPWVRWFLFISGTLLSALLTAASLASI